MLGGPPVAMRLEIDSDLVQVVVQVPEEPATGHRAANLRSWRARPELKKSKTEGASCGVTVPSPPRV
jgi:hypothetical protein